MSRSEKKNLKSVKHQFEDKSHNDLWFVTMENISIFFYSQVRHRKRLFSHLCLLNFKRLLIPFFNLNLKLFLFPIENEWMSGVKKKYQVQSNSKVQDSKAKKQTTIYVMLLCKGCVYFKWPFKVVPQWYIIHALWQQQQQKSHLCMDYFRQSQCDNRIIVIAISRNPEKLVTICWYISIIWFVCVCVYVSVLLAFSWLSLLLSIND